MTGTALHSKPFSRQCISTKNTLMAVYTSVNKHSRCMIRLLYCILLFSLCSRASLLKASVGNMTHMALSVIPTSSCCAFMIRLIPKIQLSPPPRQAGVLWGSSLFCKDKQLWVDLSSDRQTRPGKTEVMGGSSESIQQTYAGMVTDIQAALWESSRLGEWIQGFSRTVRNTVNIIYV